MSVPLFFFGTEMHTAEEWNILLGGLIIVMNCRTHRFLPVMGYLYIGFTVFLSHYRLVG